MGRKSPNTAIDDTARRVRARAVIPYAGMSLLLGLSGPAAAEVTRFEVLSVEHATLEGATFGKAGTYDRIKARVTVAEDPADRRNAVIADIALAPRNAAGKVEAVADVEILTPSDPKRGKHAIFYEIVNRGHKLAGVINDGAVSGLEKAADAGNGYLMRQGYTLVWSGWQGDLPGRPGDIAITAPTLTGMTGAAHQEFVFDNNTNPARATLAYPAADMASAKLTVRAKWTDPAAAPKDLSFRFIDPTHIEIKRPTGFDAGAEYDFDYAAKDPKVLGLGFAATRDVVDFLRHDKSDSNPLAKAGKIERAYAFGQSQSGRALREYLYLGFNEDLAGRRVFEGMLPQIPGARFTDTNRRFGEAGGNARHPQDPGAFVDRFPFNYATTTEPFTGVTDSLMQRCRATNSCPKVIQVDSEFEWWGSRGSLNVTDPAGKATRLPADVRLFMIAGVPHFNRIDAVAGPSRTCVMPLNPNHQGVILRALVSDLDSWVASGVAPPPSRTPNLSDGSLVEANTRQLDKPIPGVPYNGIHVRAMSEDLSVWPNVVRGEYKVYVPRINADAMAVGGVHEPSIAAPKATYTGWNPHVVGDGPTMLCSLQGGAVPFAATRDERLKAGDPRLSIDERYPTSAAYVAKVDAAAKALVRQRLMLAEDLPRQHAAAVADTLSKLHPAPGAPPPPARGGGGD